MLSFWVISKEKADKAFSKLCESTYKDLKKYVLRKMNGDEYSAEEIVQSTYLLAGENRDMLLNHANPEGWLSKTAENLCYKHWKYNKDTMKSETELTENLTVNDEFYYNDYNGNGNIHEELLDKILSQLSDKEKELFYDYYINKIPLKTIAKKRNYNYVNLRKFHSRLKNKLKDIVKQ